MALNQLRPHLSGRSQPRDARRMKRYCIDLQGVTGIALEQHALRCAALRCRRIVAGPRSLLQCSKQGTMVTGVPLRRTAIMNHSHSFTLDFEVLAFWYRQSQWQRDALAALAAYLG